MSQQEPADLQEFKARVWEAALAVRKKTGWCGTFYTIMHRELGLDGGANKEPTEDGLYVAEGFTYFFIRYQGRWIHTALEDIRAHTSRQHDNWDMIVRFMRDNNCMRPLTKV